MGASCRCRKYVGKNQILKDINSLTTLTQSKKFEKRCGFFIEFLYSLKSKKIHCIFV